MSHEKRSVTLKRSSKRKRQLRKILIVCEGEKSEPVNGYHKSAVLKTPIKKVNYDTIHKRIQRTGNFIV